MRCFLIHLLLLVLWLAVVPQPSLLYGVAGLLLSFLPVALVCKLTGRGRYHLRFPRAVGLILFFHYELIHSSLRVIWDIITLTPKSKPALVAMPLDARTDAEIFLTANLISLTPGTLSISIAPDRNTLYVHVMFMDDVHATLKALKNFESKILGVLR